MISGDMPANNTQREEMQSALYGSDPSRILDEVRKFYEDITIDLIRKNQRKLGQVSQIDIVKE